MIPILNIPTISAFQSLLCSPQIPKYFLCIRVKSLLIMRSATFQTTDMIPILNTTTFSLFNPSSSPPLPHTKPNYHIRVKSSLTRVQRPFKPQEIMLTLSLLTFLFWIASPQIPGLQIGVTSLLGMSSVNFQIYETISMSYFMIMIFSTSLKVIRVKYRKTWYSKWFLRIGCGRSR